MAIYRGPGGAGDATNDASSQAILAAQSAQEAAASEAAAAASAVSAANSATAASASATNASNSASSASTSASNASTSATNAASSATSAASSATAAATSETNAASSASSASTSATNAANSATSAASSATTATTQATNASNSATAAATSATNAANSATAAATSETNAAASASAASTSATNAANSATSAGNSASTATTQASNAASSASAAATSASNAATSATSASTSATSASTSATNAASSASSASTSATNASNSATAAAASYDSFDDRYLGSKTSNPTLDNDGNALLTGALYWNSVANEMRVYTGSAWVAAYVPSSTYVAKAGDVMTGSLEVPTQTSLQATTLTRASIRPSLLLDFANTRQLDPRVTFQRASTGRFYDGTSVVKAEENLLTYSQEFDNAAWGKTNATVTANTGTSPDGTTTADTLVANGVTGAHHLAQNSSATANQRIFSVYAKAGTNSFVQIAGGGDVAAYANFDISTGVLGTVGVSFTASITSVGNGWYRCVVSTTSSSVISFVIVSVSGVSAARLESNTLSTSVILWGAQLEQRSVATAYTPTTTQPITNYIPALQTAAANVARFDHDPVTGESKGLLIEEQRTNLLTYSEQLNDSSWVKAAGSVAANIIVSPDGTLSGDAFIEDTTTAAHQLRKDSIAITAGSTVTLSAYVKSYLGSRWVMLQVAGSSGSALCHFDPATGSVGVSSGTTYSISGSPTAVAIGNGWYRVSVSVVTATDTSVSARYTMKQSNNGAASYAGDGYSGIYIWGAQLEAGSFPTSYIPTVASQVTRSADSASMTGSNFTSWYRADEGTLYAEAGVQSAGTRVAISDNTNNNRLMLDTGTNVSRLYATSGGALQANITVAYTYGAITKTAGVYSSTYLNFAQNGTLGTEDTSVVVPVVDRLYIGASATGNSSYANGTIKRIAYYPKRLTNAELQGITS